MKPTRIALFVAALVAVLAIASQPGSTGPAGKPGHAAQPATGCPSLGPC
ncbi:hypothetical protein OHV05_00285 [Kitasatospora sp. NBC_00070]